MMILPTFIVGGAPRSGTTYLYELCDSHPDIYMAKPKAPEPKFFLVDEKYDRGLACYSEEYFAQAEGFRAIGEKSTNYLENPQVAQRIKQCLPDVKLVFVLRNPIKRAFSNYLWSRKNGIETLSFEEALEREKERELEYEPKYKYARPFSYISRGMYARSLKPYFELFDRSQIKILLLDDIISAPETVARELFGFLGVPMVRTSLDLTRRVNPAREPGDRMSPYTYEFLRGVYYYPNQELSELIGRDLSHWNRPLIATGSFDEPPS
jgi:hypothetical protein